MAPARARTGLGGLGWHVVLLILALLPLWAPGF